MNISYSRPLSLGYQRMKKALFQPFDLSKWFRIGFTAWLAGLSDCSGSGSGGNHSGSNTNWDEFFNFPDTAWQWLNNNPIWANLIIVGLVLLVIFISVLLWVSSRGKFMFLYNVAEEKSEIGLPWHEYKKQGNSLFLFQFFFGWLSGIVILLFLAYVFVSAKDLYFSNAEGIVIFGVVAKLIFLFILFMVTFGYVGLFLKDFVVPVMYKHRIGVLQAWGKFMSLFGRRFFTFLLYGLFIFVLGIGVGIAVVLFALITCCIGLLLIAIPYIGAVLLLPISYTFRAFSIEFLRQFGDDFDVFPKEDEVLPIIEEQ